MFPIIACSKAGRNNRKPQLIYLRHKKAENRYFFFVPKERMSEVVANTRDFFISFFVEKGDQAPTLPPFFEVC